MTPISPTCAPRRRGSPTSSPAASPTPGCPGVPTGTPPDLLAHLTRVQDFWTHVVTHRPAPPDDYAEPGRPAAYAEQLAQFRATHEAFAAALDAAGPDEPAWSWSPRPDDQRVGFSYRRQAHEALIHRLDAEQTAGAVTPLAADLAADGVHEALDLIYGTPPEGAVFTARSGYVEYRIADTATSVWTRVGTFAGTAPGGEVHDAAAGQQVVAAPGVAASLVISGSAADLDTWLWHRGGAERIAISGDDGLRRLVAGVVG